MDIGVIGVYVGLAASISAIVLYALALLGNRRVLLAARAAFGLTALSVFFCFGRLMFLVSHHHFEYQYVFKYSSADLGFPWNYAATWAGQEGSFLLWAFWTAVIGIMIAAQARKWEPRVMPFYVTTLAVLFGILVWLHPYQLIPHGTGPNDYPLDLPWPPINGQGLNPSLQNYWMAIHPPTIFFGFSSLCVAFSYAVAAMIWRDYRSWAERVMPYILMTVVTLGVGLMLGGYWAYETQGWHGFWGWDPVENASLFPWLAAVGLLHGLVVQKSRGGMGRSNVFLSIAAWLLFLWGTFLTRSGVLANISVHAFDMLGRSALVLLICLIGGHGLLGLSLLVWRWRTIPARPISNRLLTRDMAMVLAVTITIMAAVVVTVGTSWPLMSQWAIWRHVPILHTAAKPEATQPIFFNRVGSALLIPTLIIMGAVPFLAWGKTNAEKFLWKVLAPWLAAVAVGALIVWFVWGQEAGGFKPATPRMLVVVIGMLGMFVAIANATLVAKLMKPTAKSSARRTAGWVAAAAGVVGVVLLFVLSLDAWMVLVCAAAILGGAAMLRLKGVTAGGWLAHVGIGLFFVGAVLTNVYEQTTAVELLERGGPVKTPYGYTLEFAGWTHDGKPREEADREWREFSHAMKIRVTRTPSGNNVAHADDGTPESDLPAAGPLAFVAKVPVFRQHSLEMNQAPNAQQYMVWPSIHRELGRDFYVVPGGDPQLIFPHATLHEGADAPIMTPDRLPTTGEVVLRPTQYMVSYKQFFMHGAPGTAGTTMGGNLVLHTPDGRDLPFAAELQFVPEQGPRPVFADIPGINGVAFIEGGVNPGTKEMTVNFELPEYSARWYTQLSVTNKPLINVVWLGVILMAAGTICSMVRRAREARRGTLIEDAAAGGEIEEELDLPTAEVAEPAASAAAPTTNGNGRVNGHGMGKKARAKQPVA